ncbi:hypothetical protein RclHR1_35400001 [Rhizophagus clarus]|uniref:Uncharacterized protein n=1 Tax=Rhizophagus clarus TaxID=94130 RepID=A0A2Z6S5X6_9GLOM|nr:hypothetical protein RclHR1_35400001 [Rhizophagus clarus]
MPVFAGNDDDDLERFFKLYKGYIHSIGIDPSAIASNPAGWEKVMGILCACLTGPSARWYNSNILKKRIKLRNILLHAAHGDEVAFKALAGNAANCPVNIWVNPSGARHLVVHQLRFGNLFQENMPVQDFYDKVRRSAELLGYGNDVLVNQFLRGLNDDCAIEAERIGAERDIEKLVGLLEQVEKRKAELRLGLRSVLVITKPYQSVLVSKQFQFLWFTKLNLLY